MEEIARCGAQSRKSIIFCRTYKDLIEINTLLVSELYEKKLLCVDTDDGMVPICGMFSASTEKNDIQKAFVNSNGPVRIVCATFAFGMGLDAPNIRSVIHWGPSASVEAYLQETGRASRDGMDASAGLYFNRSDIAKNSPLTDSIKQYCNNSSFCRRKLLTREFVKKEVSSHIPLHKCCDICSRECACTECKLFISNDITDSEFQMFLEDESPPQDSMTGKTVSEDRQLSIEHALKSTGKSYVKLTASLFLCCSVWKLHLA